MEEQEFEWVYEIDYHSYIGSGLNVLLALGDIDIIDNKAKAKKIEIARDQAIYLIRRSIDQLVKQFDDEHED